MTTRVDSAADEAALVARVIGVPVALINAQAPPGLTLGEVVAHERAADTSRAEANVPPPPAQAPGSKSALPRILGTLQHRFNANGELRDMAGTSHEVVLGEFTFGDSPEVEVDVGQYTVPSKAGISEVLIGDAWLIGPATPGCARVSMEWTRGVPMHTIVRAQAVDYGPATEHVGRRVAFVALGARIMAGGGVR
jgi:hypothetical protein